MSQRYFGDRWYKVRVSAEFGPPQVVIGQYDTMSNAVFGALRKLRLDQALEINVNAELLPPKPRGMTKASYTRHLRAIHGA